MHKLPGIYGIFSGSRTKILGTFVSASCSLRDLSFLLSPPILVVGPEVASEAFSSFSAGAQAKLRARLRPPWSLRFCDAGFLPLSSERIFHGVLQGVSLRGRQLDFAKRYRPFIQSVKSTLSCLKSCNAVGGTPSSIA